MRLFWVVREDEMAMRVRIRATPKEQEIDGVSLKAMQPGETREVSPLVGSWLIAEGYAEPEMRRPAASEDEFNSHLSWVATRSHERERRRKKS